jgi:hypothetical protein
VGQDSSPKLAFLSRGALYLKDGEGEARLVESRLGQQIRERAAQIEERNAWKTEETEASVVSGGALWGVEDDPPVAARVTVHWVGRGRSRGEVLYALDTGELSGVLALRDFGAEEERLFHANDLRVDHLSAAPGADRIACSVSRSNGFSNIAVMEPGGSNPREVTGGDSLDAAPSWVPGEPGHLVYQSAGVGRDAAGSAVALGPFCIEKLDLAGNTVETLAEDPGYDFMTPRVTEDGALLCLRRPYRGGWRSSSFQACIDFLLLPPRLLATLFRYLKLIYAGYTGKRTASVGSSEVEQTMVWGYPIDAEKATLRGRLWSRDAPSLVPRSWQLVRRDVAGHSRVLARGVLTFDVAGDGSVIYSNGTAVDRLTPEGSRERLFTAPQVEHLVVLE